MSAYSDWKYGLITDAEYNHICREEEYWDKYFETHPEDCNGMNDFYEEDPDYDIDE